MFHNSGSHRYLSHFIFYFHLRGTSNTGYVFFHLDTVVSADGMFTVTNPQPDMTLIYNAFHRLPPNPHDIAPYFNGYLGSHVSVWPDFRQLRGLVGTASANPRPFIRLVHHRRTRELELSTLQIGIQLMDTKYLLEVLQLLLEDQRVTVDNDMCPPVSRSDKNRMVWL
jgi:hypothetical protein